MVASLELNRSIFEGCNRGKRVKYIGKRVWLLNMEERGSLRKITSVNFHQLKLALTKPIYKPHLPYKNNFIV